MICRECGEMVSAKDGYIIDGEFYCNECATECSCCGEAILKDDSHTTADGDVICERCMEDEYYTCYECGEIYHQDDLTWIENKEVYVCEECRDNYYEQCECCHRYYSTDDCYETYDHNWVCTDCYDNHYRTCQDCGYVMHDDDSYYNERDEEDYCPNCESRHRYSDAIYSYHDYSYYERLSVDDEFEPDEYFGFELEVSGDPDYAEEFIDRTSDVVLMSDCSIEDDGFEIITEPMTRRYFKEVFKPQFEESLKYLDKVGFTGHNKGGMHIHISADALSKSQLAQMSEILYGDENDRNIWLCLSQRHEDKMDEWSSMKNKDYSFEEIKNHTETNMPYISNDRRTALNRDTRTKTYEIRIFNSNTRIERVMKNMECVFALIDYTKEYQDSVYRCDTQGFLRYVKSHRFEYPNLYAFMLERRVEEHYGIKFTEEELEAA